MSIRKERIKFDNQDINLKITLDSNEYRYGYQQEIDGMTEQVKNKLINPIIDNEVRKFKYYSSSNSGRYIKFYFSSNGSSYNNTYINDATSFTQQEIENNNNNIRNSFYIVDFYDNFDFFNQNKLFTIYNSKLSNSETSSSVSIPKYRLNGDAKNQFQDWYVPKHIINDYLSSGSTILYGYIKFSFYNAKTGELILFYNKSKESLSTSERLYFKIRFDLINNTWRFDLDSSNKLAYQIPTTNAFSQRQNDTVDEFDNKQQDYPDGNVFNPEDQDYDTE